MRPVEEQGDKNVRGLVVVAIGAILIWIGLSRGGAGGVEASQGDADRVDTEGSQGSQGSQGAQGDADVREAAFSLSNGQGQRSASNGRGSGAAPDHEDSASGGEAAAVAAEDGAASASAATPEREAAPAAREAAEPAGTGPESATRIVGADELDPPPPIGELSSRREAPAASDPIALTGASKPGRSRLAEQLVDSWISQDAKGLEAFLTMGDGVDLPPAQAQLAAGFWEAMVGTVDPARERLQAVQDDPAVSTEQVALLAAALDPPGTRALPRAASAASRIEPVAYAMRMILLENEARALTKARHFGKAARAWSDLVQMEIEAPWDTHQEAVWDWGRMIALVQDNHRLSPGGDWPFVEEKVRDDDLGLTEIRARVIGRRSDLLVCVGLLREVNDVGKYIHPGQVIKVPTDHANVIVDIDSRILMYRIGDEVVRLWQVGVGKPGHETPIGTYAIGDKLEKPVHSVKLLPYGHPENPLGSRWLALYRDGNRTSYGIHGTNDESGVGEEVSLGCIRMRNAEVNELFELLPKDATVIIQE